MLVALEHYAYFRAEFILRKGGWKTVSQIVEEGKCYRFGVHVYVFYMSYFRLLSVRKTNTSESDNGVYTMNLFRLSSTAPYEFKWPEDTGRKVRGKGFWSKSLMRA